MPSLSRRSRVPTSTAVGIRPAPMRRVNTDSSMSTSGAQHTDRGGRDGIEEDFYNQTKRVTVFCGAFISLDFGPPPPRSAIEGYVTDVSGGAPGTPMPGVFVGSGFGGSATTDENGYYKLTNAPLNPDGSQRAWDVTADPADFQLKDRVGDGARGRDRAAGLHLRRNGRDRVSGRA